jgi:subtilisin family serine protease
MSDERSDRISHEPVLLDVNPLAGVDAAAKSGDVIPGQYIVVFRDDVQNPVAEAHATVGQLGGEMLYTYQHALKGFAARLPDAAVEALGRNPNIAAVESDGVVSISAGGSQASPASWGLDRIDQRALPLDDVYNFQDDGAGSHVFIIDTGLRYYHEEFIAADGSARAFLLIDAIGDGQNGWDCHGHGTHVGGTVAGNDYGVAKGVEYIWAARVLDCRGSGSWSSVIAGVDEVTNFKQLNPALPMVANMSLGGGYSSSLNAAVANSVAADVTYAVAAGNESTDACNRSPASTPEAITVGATNDADVRASFSNYGTCVDVFAPGVSITSAYYTSDTATATWNGTSMASPHVAGVAAIYLGANPNATPAQVAAAIDGGATSGIVTSPGAGSPNKLLYSLILGGTPPPDPDPITPTDVEVQSIAPVDVNGKKRKHGTTTVTVSDVSGTGMPGVTVQAHWVINGTAGNTISAPTGDGGAVTFTSSNYVGAETFGFCVTQLSGFNLNDVTPYVGGAVCAPYGDGSGGGDPPTEPPASGAPAGLTVQDDSKGANFKARLAWTDGAGSVVIYRWHQSDTGLPPNETIGPVSNSGSYVDNLGKTAIVPLWYQVCNEGQAANGEECTGVERLDLVP